MVFIKFSVLRKLEFLVSWGRLLVAFWEISGDFGVYVSHFSGYRKEVGISMTTDPPAPAMVDVDLPEGPGLQDPGYM